MNNRHFLETNNLIGGGFKSASQQQNTFKPIDNVELQTYSNQNEELTAAKENSPPNVTLILTICVFLFLAIIIIFFICKFSFIDNRKSSYSCNY